jgi:hypothetical protein
MVSGATFAGGRCRLGHECLPYLVVARLRVPGQPGSICLRGRHSTGGSWVYPPSLLARAVGGSRPAPASGYWTPYNDLMFSRSFLVSGGAWSGSVTTSMEAAPSTCCAVNWWAPSPVIRISRRFPSLGRWSDVRGELFEFRGGAQSGDQTLPHRPGRRAAHAVLAAKCLCARHGRCGTAIVEGDMQRRQVNREDLTPSVRER